MDYKEKLKLAKEALESGSYDRETIEYIFPELKESEDEKMRKKCIELIKELKTFCMRDGQNECIAWLEKQSERKPYSGTSFKYNGHTFNMSAKDNGVEILLDGEFKAFVSLEKTFVYPTHYIPSLDQSSTV